MIECKLFELRDRGTFIPIFAFRNKVISDMDGTTAQESAEDWLLRRAGFGSHSQHLVTVGHLCYVNECHWDHIEWPNPRTWGVAHKHIEEHWSELKSGDVIDVEFILGETKEKKTSERLDPYPPSL